jgi:hypothetical protein
VLFVVLLTTLSFPTHTFAAFAPLDVLCERACVVDALEFSFQVGEMLVLQI